jgi:threonine dehydratase
MIDRYYGSGERNFAISSSGNAALAAALHAKKINGSGAESISLDIFVGQNIAADKVAKLRAISDERIRVLNKERPLQALMQAVDEGARSLRQSTDDVALEGYKTLAEELAEIGNAGAIFMGTSSGTTAAALARFFSNQNKSAQIHIVQTSSCHPISAAFEDYDGPNEKSVADAIVDITAIRKPALIPLILKTGGRGWIATNDDIGAALDLTLEHTGLTISPNSALSVVGAMHAAYRGFEFDGAAVCLICGA